MANEALKQLTANHAFFSFLFFFCHRFLIATATGPRAHATHYRQTDRQKQLSLTRSLSLYVASPLLPQSPPSLSL